MHFGAVELVINSIHVESKKKKKHLIYLGIPNL